MQTLNPNKSEAGPAPSKPANTKPPDIAWLPGNLIQAQRDYFRAHTYERIDAKGMFHTEWEKERES